MRKGLLLLILLAACSKKGEPAAATPGGSATPAGPVGMLKDLQNGDRACYVVLEVDGEERSIEGDFELCAGGSHDATALVGTRVTYTTERANVQAASCEGDPDCTASDEVDLVKTISAAP